jgi:hypothetical protein
VITPGVVVLVVAVSHWPLSVVVGVAVTVVFPPVALTVISCSSEAGVAVTPACRWNVSDAGDEVSWLPADTTNVTSTRAVARPVELSRIVPL